VRIPMTKFYLKKFVDENICLQVGGVVEYAVEECDEDEIDKELERLVNEKKE